MGKIKNKPAIWSVNFKYSVFENIMNGGTLVLKLDKIKNQIIVTEAKQEKD